MPKQEQELYKLLLTDLRRRTSTGPKRNLAMQAASDKGRVLFSAAFRRLQSKTQVFPQEWNASVRTRLTHSIEVATIGRYLAEGITEKLLEKKFLGNIGDSETLHKASAFITFVEVACLMHDIGNPPFGHFGEKSIQEWFIKREEGYRNKFKPKLKEEFDKFYTDFSTFDGNPQGFRLATRLQWVYDEFGYNLTYSQLAATLKYPWTPERIGTKQNNRTIKKAGVFFSETAILDELQSNLKLTASARHPLVYVMEAADDISYCLSDIEDALEKCVVRNKDVIENLRQKLSSAGYNKFVIPMLEALPKAGEEIENSSWFVRFRTTVTNVLVERACNLYINHHKEIIEGQYFSLLSKSRGAQALLDVIDEFSEQHLYRSPVVRERELVGYQVIHGILDRFGLLLDLSSIEAEALLIEKKSPKATGMALASTLESFLPRKHLKVYEHALKEIKESMNISQQRRDMLEWMARAHLLVDFLSGMTDDFAIVTYRRLYDGGSSKI
ncbi:MAG: dGTPase [Methylococcaceae bacterium]|nr:dGTPase [Methylococcaceae bacterium]MDP3902864.1 dGTPase [Methylococcaceae bacterium]